MNPMLAATPSFRRLPSWLMLQRRPAALAIALIGLVLVGQGIWIHAKAVLAQVLLERAFAETIAIGKAVKPWSWADTWSEARIEVPRLHRMVSETAAAEGR